MTDLSPVDRAPAHGPEREIDMGYLNPTPARRRLLADVQHHRVYQHPDGATLNAGASGRQVTTSIAHLEGAGWVRLGEGSDYDIRYWELTNAGKRVLDEAGRARPIRELLASLADAGNTIDAAQAALHRAGHTDPTADPADSIARLAAERDWLLAEADYDLRKRYFSVKASTSEPSRD